MTKAPPGLSTSLANSAAASASPMMRKWSVRTWPVPWAAMSERTMSALPSRSMALSRAGSLSVQKVQLEEIDAGDRLHVQEIDGHHLAPALDRLDPVGRHLRPAAGRRAQIHDALARLQQCDASQSISASLNAARER